MKRKDFFKTMGLGTLLIGGSPGRLFSEQDRVQAIQRFFEDNLIIDGTMQPRPSDVSVWPREPGMIRRLTGVDVAAMTVSEENIDRIGLFLDDFPEAYLRIENAGDIRRAHREGKYGYLFYFQNRFRLDDAPEERLLQWFESGLRVLQFTYIERNELGGGSRADEVPLTDLGRAFLTTCNEIGIVVDVSHCGRRTTMDVARLSSKPITANHCNAAQLSPGSRNKSLDELKAIAETGGVIGVMPISPFLSPARGQKATIEDFIAQVEYMVETVGIDHVGVATDAYLDGRSSDERYEAAPPLSGYTRWFHVALRLTEKGYDSAALRKVFGGNFLRVYERVLPET